MVDYLYCKLDDIIEDAKANGRVAELKTIAATPVADRKPSYMEIKRAYYEKFYAELLPKAKEKKPSMWDIIESL